MRTSIYRTILTTSLVFLFCTAEAITKTRKEYNLFGDVYCIGVKEYSFNIEFGELNRGELLNETYTYFLQNGNVFIDSLIDKKMYRRYEYDKHNNIIQEMRILVGAGKKGRIGNTDILYNDTTDIYLYSNDYGEDGQIKEIKKFSNDGIQIQRILCSRTAAGESLMFWNRRYPEKEIITTKTSIITKLYSELNDFKSPTVIVHETLNDKGFPINETIEAVGGLVTSEKLYKYDEHDNVINETSKVRNALGQGENVSITNRYDYDDKGNWIRKIEFKNGQVKSWTERIIFYASSPSDYTKIVEQDKQLSEKHKKIWNRERQYEDSLAMRKKIYEDSLATRKKIYEDSLTAVICKLDVLLEKELLQKHIMAVPRSNFDNYNFDIKLREIDGYIKSFTTSGNSISLKKGKTTINVDLMESRTRWYYWSWNENSEGHEEFQVGYSNDYSDIIIARPFMLLLHKEDNVYKAYILDNKIINLFEINNILQKIEKENPIFLKEYIQLFWNTNKGSVADYYKNIESIEKTNDSNEKTTVNNNTDNSEIYNRYDMMPEFPGGNSALLNYLGKSIRYPVYAKENGIQGRVICSFIVETDGSISNIEVTKSLDPSLDKEAIRIISSMPKWKPALYNGTPVRCHFSTPINFRLQ